MSEARAAGAASGQATGATSEERSFPLLHQINTTVLLSQLGRAATLDDVTDRVLDAALPPGTDWVWMLGVWQTGDAARAISRADPAVRRAADELLGPDWTDADISGSPFAITGFEVADRFGGAAALGRLRARLARRGIRLMLDFIPNHTAPDHPWVRSRPDLYVRGDAETIHNDPLNWRRIDTDEGEQIIALGRDPYFPGWADTLQLDYANPETQARMRAALLDVAALCDGVRVDMAMLVLPEVVRRTWQRDAADFWPDAIGPVRRAHRGFVFLAEVYWGLEDALIARGFDYAYDKALYDALAARDASRARASLAAPPDRQATLARFTENHDEMRAASVFPWPVARTAHAIALLAPGLRLTHAGEAEGARDHVSMHLGRAPEETPDPDIVAYFAKLFAVLDLPVLHEGRFAFLEPEAAWSGNPSHSGFVLFTWIGGGRTVLVAANHAPDRGQCRVWFDTPADGPIHLADLVGQENYTRDAGDIARHGLYLDLPAWGLNVFDVGKG